MADIAVEPATADRWPDVEAVFGKGGAYYGCWCAYFDLRRKDFSATRAVERKAMLRERVEGEEPPGLLAYLDGTPVGWVRLAPRTDLPHLVHSRKLAPVDDLPVWSVVCFVVRRGYRGQGVMTGLLDAAVTWAFARGAPAVEAYPVEPRPDGLPGCHGYEGILSTFLAAGFVEVARPRADQAIVRKRP